jgi:uncharacterized protein
MTMESPCRKICVVDAAQRRCAACLRSLDEIANWSSYSADQRRRIMAELPRRQANARDNPSALAGKV